MGSEFPPLPLSEIAPNKWVKVFPDHDCEAHLPACEAKNDSAVVLCECGRFYRQRHFLGHRYWAWTLM